MQAALKYAGRGWPVFPCRADKGPLTKHGFKDASTDRSQIVMWWMDSPHALIGHPTGNGHIVIDVDGPAGESSLATLPSLPETATVKTGRGRHLYYAAGGIANSQGDKVAQGIDIRGDGGYVILPPSPHPSGSNYEWLSQKIVPLPDAWHKLLTATPSVALGPPSSPRTIPAGRGHATLLAAARRSEISGATRDEAKKLLTEMAKRCETLKSEREIDEILRYVYERPSAAAPGTVRIVTAAEAAREFYDFASRPETPSVKTGIRAIDEALGGIYPHEMVVLAAETGAGKTLFSQQVCRTACDDGIHSLYVSLEMTASQLMGRCAAMRCGIPPSALRQPGLLTSEQVSALSEWHDTECKQCRIVDTAHNQADISSAIRASRPGLVVIDYDELVQSARLDGVDAQASVAAYARRLAADNPIVVWLVSQFRKASQGDSGRVKLDRLYGSGAKTKHAAAVLVLEKNGDLMSVRILKNRNGCLADVTVRLDRKKLEFVEV